MTTAGQTIPAAIYCRISLARDGDTTKTDEQERICRHLAGRLGWRVAEVYTDNSASAWSRTRKRPAWERMLADIDDGKIAGVVVYHGDRLVRQPYDLEKLLTLAEAKGIRLASPTGTRDLDDTSDRFVLRILTAQACMESDNTSRRRKAQYKRWAREGRTRPGGRGGRALGFATDGMTLVPEEAAVIREMAARVLAGETPGPISADLTARGFRTPGGYPIRHHTVRDALTRPRTAGLMPDGESKAAWEPILDRQTWEQAGIAIQARKEGKFSHASNVRRWLLSALAECGKCGGTLTAAYARQSKEHGLDAVVTYTCREPGCRKIARNAAYLDAYVSARVVALLNDPRQPQGRLPVREGDAAEWAALGRERAETEELLAKPGRSAGRARVLDARLDAIDERMAQLRDREAGDARARLLSRHHGITLAQFEAEPLAVRRALVAASYRITVLPASARGRGVFRTEDVRMDPPG